MIISKTPFRVSFFGGGTDYPAWFERNGGAVLSTTIDKYCYISMRYLPPFFDHKHRIIYSQIENVKSVNQIRHPVVRELLKYFRIKKGVEIHHDGDLPARSGLGSSSAFTVGMVNSLYALKGKIVSKERAAILEKEWGKKPFISAVTGKPETPADTVPPTLSFRVEVMRSKKPVKDDVIEGISKTAGTRGLETIQLDDGTSVYLIGMFITYESAEEYTDLLIRNGYREARITAWLGKKEIPVDTARELFDRLK